MRKELVNNLKNLTRIYHKETGIPLSEFSEKVAKSRAFLGDLDPEQTNMTLARYDRIVSNIWKNWPKGIDWPSDIQVPEESHTAA